MTPPSSIFMVAGMWWALPRLISTSLARLPSEQKLPCSSQNTGLHLSTPFRPRSKTRRQPTPDSSLKALRK